MLGYVAVFFLLLLAILFVRWIWSLITTPPDGTPETPPPTPPPGGGNYPDPRKSKLTALFSGPEFPRGSWSRNPLSQKRGEEQTYTFIREVMKKKGDGSYSTDRVSNISVRFRLLYDKGEKATITAIANGEKDGYGPIEESDGHWWKGWTDQKGEITLTVKVEPFDGLNFHKAGLKIIAEEIKTHQVLNGVSKSVVITPP